MQKRSSTNSWYQYRGKVATLLTVDILLLKFLICLHKCLLSTLCKQPAVQLKIPKFLSH